MTTSNPPSADSPLATRSAKRLVTRALFDQQARRRVAKLPRLLRIAEVAEHLGGTERHIRRLVSERRIPYVKWGHLLRFDPDEIAAWLHRARRPPDEGSGAAGWAS